MLNALLETTSVSFATTGRDQTIYTVPSGRRALIIASGRTASSSTVDAGFLVNGGDYFFSTGQFETFTWLATGSVQATAARNVVLYIFLLPSDII